ncbi:MAG: hypothetical protein LPK19_05175 [Hymenobacteraceae bacterium]|nr:hypothetical protein [Hymenobacteraceae bacterium]MDX5395591.1 hypothetical protein [Hymenobacteraceae bacterium]MDX5511643.1 hypothetical protein [Hymenobacteraceae bacterium]
MAIIHKVTIAGNSGAGKSTLALQLGEKLQLPVFHIDKIQFKPGWELTPEEEFNRQQDVWLQQERWLIEGVGPWQALKQRFEASDTIIYLDYPVELCLQRAQQRLQQDLEQPSPFLPDNCPYAEKAEKQQEVIRFFQQEWRPKILALQQLLSNGRNCYVFKSEKALTEHLLTSFL